MTTPRYESASGDGSSLSRRRFDWQRSGEGFALGALIGLCADQLGLNALLHSGDMFLFAALIGAILARTRLRKGLWCVAAVLLLILTLVGYTPLVSRLMSGLYRRDRLRPAPVIVVLSAAVQKDKTLNAAAQARVLHGYELLRQGIAPRLLLTNATVPYGSEVPTIRQQMQTLGLDYPVEETGPVADTHDEAVEVARLARQRHWEVVILVTHAWHMRRAAAVFEKAGIHVLCSPCVEGEIDLALLNTPGDRLRAFRDWLHEAIGYRVYQLRGWI